MDNPEKEIKLITRRITMNHDEVLNSFVEHLELWWRRNLKAITSPELKAFFRDVLNNCERYERKTNDPNYAELVLLLDKDEILDEVLVAEVRDKGKTIAFTRMRSDKFKRNYRKRR